MAGSPTDSGLGTSVTSGSVAPETPSPPPASSGGCGGARTGGCGGPGGFCPCREAQTGESVPLNLKKRPGSPSFSTQRKPAPPLETDFTNLFNRVTTSSSNPSLPATASSSSMEPLTLNLGADSSMGMGMPCGLCQDGGTCICAEFAEAERKKKEDMLRSAYDDDAFSRSTGTSLENFANSLRLATSMSSNNTTTSIINSGLTATAGSSTINQLLNEDPLWKEVTAQVSDPTWTPYIKDEDLDMDIESTGWKGLPSMRWDTNLDLGLNTPPTAPVKNKGGCTGEGPGNCDLCRKDARASLFCLSVTKVVSEKRNAATSVPLPPRRAKKLEVQEDRPEDREIDFTTLGKSKAKVTVTIASDGTSTPSTSTPQPQQPEKIYLSCRDAYISLSKHQGFRKAMMESIILPLETRQDAGEGGRFTVEANSVRSVLERLDREFGKS
ncbi:hypothetical protein BJ508DRAFT_159809 [Ascobolus immersus RN42]|uniref:Uncharacterized protein n=1 Tax=Ascobolus immersus RN42 TaxID=1160509 RepID=A0A3N4HWF3_ASCIM|nr:hypothetical protein BJ508DRAFT_159809 [Ascobolus immersus RN42]